MKVKGNHFETIWIHPEDPGLVQIIDQRFLPFEFRIENLHNEAEVFLAIRDMHVRGAPLIGAAGALGMYLAVRGYPGNRIPVDFIDHTATHLKSARPTAVNLAWAVDKLVQAQQELGPGDAKPREDVVTLFLETALEIIDQERQHCKRIGEHGVGLIRKLSVARAGATVNILTHCNAGWLACIDYGTATAPIYLAHDLGIPVHVWVDETRPRNQGARLTAWELQQHGVPCTVIADNTGGYLMQQGRVDLVMVGSDRASPSGDIVNKVGTYLKALAANDNHIPFYAALPSSTIDWTLSAGALETPIEERDGDELRIMEGLAGDQITRLEIIPAGTKVANYAFDITPARLVTGIITERGISLANKKSIFTLFPERT